MTVLQVHVPAASVCQWKWAVPWPHIMSCEVYAMSQLCLMNKPCKHTHPLQMLLYTSPLNLMRDPHSTILWFTRTVLMKLSQSFKFSRSISEILQSIFWWVLVVKTQDMWSRTLLACFVGFLFVSLPFILFCWPIALFPSCTHLLQWEKKNRCLKIHC